MGDFDIKDLLSEVSAKSPCGEDISYDPAYLTLENLVRPQTTGDVLGEEGVSEEPNWQDVRDRSLELLKQSKDLRIATYLTLALLRLEGIPGLRDGLFLLHGFLERYWDDVHPQLDPEDNNDPLERMNILLSLSPASVSVQDPMKFRQRLLELPLCNSARIGRFSLRDIQVAKGEISVSADEGAEAPTMSGIDAAFQDTATDELITTSQATEEAIECVNAITGTFSERASQGQSPDLSGFQAVLRKIQKCVQGYLAKRGHSVTVQQGVVSTGDKDEEEDMISNSGEIRSSKEAISALDKVCRYFERHEPSSPVPLLLRRAQRLVSKSFLEVIEDFCPDAMNQIETISGTGRSDSETGQADE